MKKTFSKKQCARITRKIKAHIARVTLRYGKSKWDFPEKFKAEIFAGMAAILTEEGIK